MAAMTMLSVEISEVGVEVEARVAEVVATMEVARPQITGLAIRAQIYAPQAHC